VPIKVVHIVGSGTVGGAENFVYSLARYQHVHDPEIEPAILFRKPKGYFYDKAIENNIEVYACKEKIDFIELRNIVKYFRRFNVLHFHGLYPLLFLAAILSFRPKLYYVHGARALTKSAKDVFKQINSTDNGRKFPTFNGLKRFMKRQWFKIFLKYFVFEIHTPSYYYKKFYQENYGINESKIKVLSLGVDFISLKITKNPDEIKKEFNISPSTKIVGSVSAFRKLKRIDRLITSFVQLIEKHPEIDCKLLIVGDGAERENLEELVSDYHIESKVIFTGLRNDVPDFLNIMDVFVLPSEFESFSISIVEAMFFKIPVIVFKDSGGAEEIVRNSHGGLVVKNDEEMTDKMKYLLDNSKESMTLGKQGHQYILTNFTVEIFSKKIKGVYIDVVNKKS
jgi:glycosyltransferase involved in cell wall biosynthesis